jgi:ubiquitin C
VKSLIERFPAAPQALPIEQYLLYQDQPVTPESSLAQCGVTDGAQVRIISRIIAPFVVWILIPEGKRLKVDVNSSDETVAQVKERIKSSEELQSSLYSLLFHDMMLADAQCLAYYSILADSELTLEPKSREKRKIRVLIPSGKTASLQIDMWTTVATLKQMLSEEGVQFSGHRLVFEGKSLQDNQFLACFSLPILPTLQLKPSNYQIFVKVPNGNTITVDVVPTDTIQAIKAKIGAKEGIPADRWLLRLSGQQLQDTKTLEESNVQKDSTLILMPRAGKIAQQLFISVMDKVIAVHAEPNDTLRDIKGRVTVEGLEMERCSLMYRGISLKDESKTPEKS